MSTEPDDDVTASLQQLAPRTSAAVDTLQQRVTLTDVLTPTPPPGRISLAPHKEPSPVPPGVPRISLAGSRPTPASFSPAEAPSWAQNGRDTSLRAAKALAMRIPGALTAMAAITVAPSSPTLPKVRLKPPVTRSSHSTALTSAPSTPLAHPTPSIRPARATTAAAISYLCSLPLLLTALRSGREPAVAAWFGACLLYQVLRFVWLHRVWRVLPAAEFVNGSGNPITPTGAVGRHFIPFYYLYWGFAARNIVCKALKIAAARAGIAEKPPQVTGVLAGVVDLIPCANFLISPLFDILFMTRVDRVVDRIRRARTP